MAAAGLATGWYIGWAIALVVVVVAAGLLIAIIGLGRRVSRQADEITAALGGARSNTAPLYDLARTNLALDQIARGLAQRREGGTG